ncbi:MAG: hypothetical protein NTZ97_04120 [Candidatus Moranbacteria bacterium]|nr:hypothetical protein [Candidatus Moranbacteria bacterium]
MKKLNEFSHAEIILITDDCFEAIKELKKIVDRSSINTLTDALDKIQIILAFKPTLIDRRVELRFKNCYENFTLQQLVIERLEKIIALYKKIDKALL